MSRPKYQLMVLEVGNTFFSPLREMTFFPSTSVFLGSEPFPAGTLERSSEQQLARRYFKQTEIAI